MVVVSVIAIVRVQPSSVFSDTFEPLMAVIVMSRKPPRRRSPRPAAKRFNPAPSRFGATVPGAALAAGAALGAALGSAPIAVDGDVAIAPTTATTASTRRAAAMPARTVPERPFPGWTGSLNSISFGSVIDASETRAGYRRWARRVVSATHPGRTVKPDSSRVLRISSGTVPLLVGALQRSREAVLFRVIDRALHRVVVVAPAVSRRLQPVHIEG